MTPQPIAVAVVHLAGRFLIGRRGEGVHLAGYWEFPGGKPHAGEAPAEAARRECREETGLEVQVQRLLRIVPYRYEDRELELHFFLCQPCRPEEAPREPFRWVDARDLPHYTFPPANAAVLADLMRDRAAGPG